MIIYWKIYISLRFIIKIYTLFNFLLFNNLILWHIKINRKTIKLIKSLLFYTSLLYHIYWIKMFCLFLLHFYCRIIHVCDIARKVEERYIVEFLCDPETASRETDFTFLWNKAHNVRCTISRRYLRIAVFWDIKFSISSWSIFQLCLPADLPRVENKMPRETISQSPCSGTRTCHYYGVNQYKSTYIRAHCPFRNVSHRPYDPLTRNTRAILWSRREDVDDEETTDDDCTISISWISYSLTEIWSRTLSNVRLRDNHLERVYNSPRIFILPAAANCDSLTAVTKIRHKELSLTNSPNDPFW